MAAGRGDAACEISFEVIFRPADFAFAVAVLTTVLRAAAGTLASSLAVRSLGMSPVGEWRLVKAQNFLTQSLASWRVG